MATIPQLSVISSVDDSTSIVGYRNSTGRISVGTLKSYLSTTTALPTLPISNVTGLQSALDAKQALSSRGVANGYAPLDSTGKVPAVNLPTVSSGGGSTTVAIADVTDLQTVLNSKQSLGDKGAANGYAPLDWLGKIPSTHLPDVAGGITEDYLTPIEVLTGSTAINQTTAHNKVFVYDSTSNLNVTLEARDVGTVIRFIQVGDGYLTFFGTSGGQRGVTNEQGQYIPYTQPAQTLLTVQGFTRTGTKGSSVMAILIKPTVWHLSGALI